VLKVRNLRLLALQHRTLRAMGGGVSGRGQGTCDDKGDHHGEIMGIMMLIMMMMMTTIMMMMRLTFCIWLSLSRSSLFSSRTRLISSRFVFLFASRMCRFASRSLSAANQKVGPVRLILGVAAAIRSILDLYGGDDRSAGDTILEQAADRRHYHGK
jgi:hypothetical protein